MIKFWFHVWTYLNIHVFCKCKRWMRNEIRVSKQRTHLMCQTNNIHSQVDTLLNDDQTEFRSNRAHISILVQTSFSFKQYFWWNIIAAIWYASPFLENLHFKFKAEGKFFVKKSLISIQSNDEFHITLRWNDFKIHWLNKTGMKWISTEFTSKLNE